MTRKTPRRLLGLLQAILAFGRDNVPISRLMDTLWPEADGDAAYRALISAVARLRKLLGHGDAIIFQEGRLGLNLTMVWVDAVAFELLVEESNCIPTGTTQSNRVVEQALQLYRGAFLADEPETAWAEPTRERIRAMYIHLVEGAVQSYRARGNWDEAIAHAERAVEIEPFSEALYRLLMTTLQQSGHIHAAQDAYIRCCKALRQSGNGLPSQETIQIYKALPFC